MARYEQQRNTFALPMYEFITQLTAFDPPPPEMQALFAALVGNAEHISRFYGVLDGTVSAPDFFAPESVAAIMGKTGPTAPAA